MIDKMLGYKATDKDMKCLGHQFVLGEWYEVQGELKMCENGFHFCERFFGPWFYYPSKGTRLFKIEAEEVLWHERSALSSKCVARRIRLINEISWDEELIYARMTKVLRDEKPALKVSY